MTNRNHAPLDVNSPYLTPQEAAAYLRYPTVHAFRMAVRRLGIPFVRRGRRLLFTVKGLDDFMAVVSDATNPRRGGRKSKRTKAA